VNSVWKFVLNESSVQTLLAARSDNRRRLLAFFRHLAEDPNLSGDFEVHDDTGRVVQIKVAGRFLVTYWADQSCREMRVIDIETA
jgi:hypothetical protein